MNMEVLKFPESPIPQQEELLPVSPSVAIVEYQQSFKNQNVNLPEIALRYLIWLIASDATPEDIKLFSNQMRIELNQQRLDRLKKSTTDLTNKTAIR